MLSTNHPYVPGDELVTFRSEDEAECLASGGAGCADSIRHAYRSGAEISVSRSPRTGLPIAFFGMTEIDDLQGAVWMLATPEITRSARSVVHWTPSVLRGWHERRPLLFNHVDARNELHIRWLKRLGFTFIALHPEHGIERRPFYEFVRLSVCADQQQSP